MDELPFEQQFHFRDGTAAKDLEELKAKVEAISYDEFYGHVNEEKNDFANWVEHVLGDKGLAKRLRAVSSIVETVELLNEELYPDQVKEAEAKLGVEDFQVRIEEDLFRNTEAPAQGAASPAPDSEWTTDEEVEQEAGNEAQLPSREELEFAGRTPGAPVTTREPAHVPITEKVGRPVSHEEHMRFLVWQSGIGFVLGLVVGFILARVLGL